MAGRKKSATEHTAKPVDCFARHQLDKDSRTPLDPASVRADSSVQHIEERQHRLEKHHIRHHTGTHLATMSFFTNPFAPNTPPVFASSALHPIAPSATFPVPASIRRASQVRSASPAISDASHVAVIVPGSLGQHSKGPPRASPSPPATASLALRKNSSASPSSSMNRSHSHSRAISSEAESPGSRRGSGQSSINLGPCPPTSTSPAPSGPFANAPGLTGRDLIEKHVPDFSRRRSVDVGVLGVHRLSAGSSLSRRVREAVGPDAADKEVGVIGAGGKGGKDRL